MPVTIDSSTGKTTTFDVVPAPAPADDMPTITVSARFPWYGWLGVGFLAGWIASTLIGSSRGFGSNRRF